MRRSATIAPAPARRAARVLAVVPIVTGVGCAALERSAAPPPAQQPAAVANPAPVAREVQRFNLAGFSEAYRAGHADACAEPPRRNEARLESDGDYSMGWNDGRFACGPR